VCAARVVLAPAMNALLSRLIAICRLRLGPQDMPYAPATAKALVVTVLMLEVVLSQLLDVPDGLLLPRTVLSAVMLVGAPWLLLHLRARSGRLVQTLIALAGTSLLFTLALVPLLLLTAASSVDPAAPAPLVSAAVLLLVVWKLMVNGHILRFALDWPPLAAALLALGLFLVELGLDQWLQGSIAT
jgi:hypothetical protein